MQSEADLPSRSLSLHSEATASTTTVLASEYHSILDIPDEGDHHHPTPTPGRFIPWRRRFFHVTRHSEIRRRRRRSSPIAAGRGPSDARARPRRLTEHIFNYAINSLILLLSPYVSGGAAGRLPGPPVMKVFTVATLLSFALAWAHTYLGRPRSPVAHVIRVLAAASAVVMFSANGWIVVPKEHRWLACMMGVFLSIFLFQHWVPPFLKGKIWAFLAPHNRSDMIPVQN